MFRTFAVSFLNPVACITCTVCDVRAPRGRVGKRRTELTGGQVRCRKCGRVRASRTVGAREGGARVGSVGTERARVLECDVAGVADACSGGGAAYSRV